MTARGHEMCITARDKDRSVELLRAFDLPYRADLAAEERRGGLAVEMAQRTPRLMKVMRAFRPDVMTGIMGPSIALAGALRPRRVPAVVFYDTEFAVQTNRVVFPLAYSVCTPDCYQGTVRGPAPDLRRLPRAGLPAPEPLPARSRPARRVRRRAGRALLDRAVRVVAGRPRPAGAGPDRQAEATPGRGAAAPRPGAGLLRGPAHRRPGRPRRPRAGRGDPPPDRPRPAGRGRVGHHVLGGGRTRGAGGVHRHHRPGLHRRRGAALRAGPALHRGPVRHGRVGDRGDARPRPRPSGRRPGSVSSTRRSTSPRGWSTTSRPRSRGSGNDEIGDLPCAGSRARPASATSARAGHGRHDRPPGPRRRGLLLGDGVHLGNRRLAIQDVPGGAQPMANEDGSVVVVYNGEIYNYPELRERVLARGHRLTTHCDTEVLPHLYEDEGIGFAARLNGIFAFALFDRARRRLFLVRDPLGMKPLVYAVRDGKLAFGSEAKAVLASGLVARRARRGEPAPVDERPLRPRRPHLLRGDPAPAARPRARVRRRASPAVRRTRRSTGPRTRPDPGRVDGGDPAPLPGGGQAPADLRRAGRRVAVGRGRLELRSWPCSAGPPAARSRPSASASTNRGTRPTTPGSWRGPSAPTITSWCCTSRPSAHLPDAIRHTEEPKVNSSAAVPAAPLHRRARQRGAVRAGRRRAVRRLRLLRLPGPTAPAPARVVPGRPCAPWRPSWTGRPGGRAGLGRPELDLLTRKLEWLASVRDGARHYLLLRNAWDFNPSLLRRVYTPEFPSRLDRVHPGRLRRVLRRRRRPLEGQALRAEFATKMVCDLLHNEDTMSMAHSVESRRPAARPRTGPVRRSHSGPLPIRQRPQRTAQGRPARGASRPGAAQAEMGVHLRPGRAVPARTSGRWPGRC